jgi:phosphotriesterase-related protein
MVNTVRGKIKPEEMGNTTVHEHMVGALEKTRPEFVQEEHDFVIGELIKAKEAGLDTLVEVSPSADINQIKYMADRVPINIVPCTGFYCFWTDEQKEYSIEKFLEHMLFEAENGIGGSGILPGVIKIASARPVLQPCEVRALTAAGKAQKITGLPMCVHSSTGTRYQQYLIEAAGANMEKVYFSHLESPTDRENRTLEMQIDYIIKTMERGSYVSFNGFLYPIYLPNEEVAEMVRQIVARGYAHKFLLSLDSFWTYRKGRREFINEEAAPYVLDRTVPFLMTHVLPWLREIGISEDDIDKMIRRNVCELFK